MKHRHKKPAAHVPNVGERHARKEVVAALSARPKIILNMIVKNEGKIIDRCLDAAFGFVDAFVIVDTGSTDDTVKKIKQASRRHGTPGVVSTDKWKNFGHNRTRAARLAFDYAKQRKLDLGSTYLLFLDADMVLKSRGFSHKELVAPAYRLEQVTDPVSWSNTRLGRMDHDWLSVGVTHEFWRATPDVPQPEHLSSLYIDDKDDGGTKGEKTERDIRLLEAAIKETPRDDRAFFYLAQTFYGVGRYEEAIELYRKRMAMGGWDEEVWYSQFRIGMSYIKLDERETAAKRPGKEAEAIVELLKAYDIRPSRAEPLAELSRFLRKKRTSATAYMLAEKALATPVSTDNLFVDTSAYRVTPLEELSILGYYHGSRRKGERAAEALLATRQLDEGTYYRASNNLLFYKPDPVLPRLRAGSFDVPFAVRTFERKGASGQTTYLASSPSFVTVRGTTYVTVRLVNYEQKRGLWYVAMDPDGKIRTENAVAEFDPDTGKTGEFALSRTDLMTRAMKETRILGIEDQRWTEVAGKVVYTAVSLEVAGFEDEAQVVVGSESGDCEGMPLAFSGVPVTWIGATRCEKNWLPFSYLGELHLIYGYDPFVVLKVDPETGIATAVSTLLTKTRMARWRGSAAPVMLSNGKLLLMVHEVISRFDDPDKEKHDRVYMHRFVELHALVPVRYSEAFSFDHHGVEYACGLLPHGDNVIIGYSYEDREARWVEISMKDVQWFDIQVTE